MKINHGFVRNQLVHACTRIAQSEHDSGRYTPGRAYDQRNLIAGIFPELDKLAILWHSEAGKYMVIGDHDGAANERLHDGLSSAVADLIIRIQEVQEGE